MRTIDADAVFELFKPFKDTFTDEEVMSAYFQTLMLIHNAPTIETKQIKYFDEDEKVWKIGSVIVDE